MSFQWTPEGGPLGPPELQHASDLVKNAHEVGVFSEELHVDSHQGANDGGSSPDTTQAASNRHPQLLVACRGHLQHEILFAAEVEVERSLRDAGVLGQILDARLVKATFSEQSAPRRQKLAPGALLTERATAHHEQRTHTSFYESQPRRGQAIEDWPVNNDPSVIFHLTRTSRLPTLVETFIHSMHQPYRLTIAPTATREKTL